MDKKEYIPYIAIPPGEHIKDEIDERGWTQRVFADIIGVSEKHMSQLIKGDAPITYDMAVKLAEAFNISPGYWMNLEYNFQKTKAHIAEASSKKDGIAIKSRIFELMPIPTMIKKGWLKPYSTTEELVKIVQRFWEKQDTTLSFLEDQKQKCLAHLSEARTDYNCYHLQAWLQEAKLIAKSIKSVQYNPDKVKEISENLHKYTLMHFGVREYIQDLQKAGVIFFILSHLPQTYLDGASFKTNDNPVLVFTSRFTRLDHFWFINAHEIAHILTHLTDDKEFIDDEANYNDMEDHIEMQANQLATIYLHTNKVDEWFKNRKISKESITECAYENQISTSIVVGRLRHIKLIEYKEYPMFNEKIDEVTLKEYQMG